MKSKELKRKEAKQRNAERELRTPLEQLLLLTERGMTAKKERDKLKKLIASNKYPAHYENQSD